MNGNLFLVIFFIIFVLNPLYGSSTIKVGVLHSKTGVMAQNEVPVLLATLAAIEEINQDGGINGKFIEAIEEDGESDPAKFALAANRLLDQGIETIFGTWTSASRKAVKEVLEKRGGLLFYPIQFEGLEDSPHIVYLGTTPNQQLITASSWAMQNLGNRFFLVGSDYIYPKASCQILRDYLLTQGALIEGEELLPLTDMNFAPVVEKIKRIKPSVIINLVNGDGNRVLFTLLENDPELKKLPIISLSVTEDNIQTWNSQLDNHYLCWSYFQNLKTAENINFISKIRKQIDPRILINDPMETAFFGVKIWANSYKNAINSSISALLFSIKGQGITAAEGIIGLTPSLYLLRNVGLAKVFHNKIPQIIWRSINPIYPEPFPNVRSKEEWEDLLKRWYQEWGNKWGS